MKTRYLTGMRKAWIYLRIMLHVPLYYLFHASHFRSPRAYFRFLCRAVKLLMVFRHNKVVRVFNGYKLHLYLPAYPSKAFFFALESKLLREDPGATTVVFSMTKACRYRCKHCYQKSDRGADLDESLMIKTALAVRDAGVAMFDIEGGEPFVRFERLQRLVAALDERSEVWANTTGGGIEPGMLEKLKADGLFGLMVSIHSPDPEVHDGFTGVPGSHVVACETLRACHRLGLVGAVNSVLSEDDIDAAGLEPIMELSRELGCDYVQLIHPKPAGIWLGRKEQMQTRESILEDVRKEHLRYNRAETDSYPSLAAQVFEEGPHVLGCTAGGVDRFYVGASGEVQPCEFLNISFGNVKEESFEVIFSRMRSYFPSPCVDWLCCTQADAICERVKQRGRGETPLPWVETKPLVEQWQRGEKTPIYESLGIYK